ncbi:MAG: hypothetical protein R3F43_23705 [bacterium]
MRSIASRLIFLMILGAWGCDDGGGAGAQAAPAAAASTARWATARWAAAARAAAAVREAAVPTPGRRPTRAQSATSGSAPRGPRRRRHPGRHGQLP